PGQLRARRDARQPPKQLPRISRPKLRILRRLLREMVFKPSRRHSIRLPGVRFEVWDLELLWTLVLGIWSFRALGAVTPPSAPASSSPRPAPGIHPPAINCFPPAARSSTDYPSTKLPRAARSGTTGEN